MNCTAPLIGHSSTEGSRVAIGGPLEHDPAGKAEVDQQRVEGGLLAVQTDYVCQEKPKPSTWQASPDNPLNAANGDGSK